MCNRFSHVVGRLCFEVDEKIFNENKAIRGIDAGSPYAIEYLPSKDIKGDYSADVRYGMLANFVNSFTYVSTPITTFAGGTNWKYVDIGNEHVSAIKTDGTLWMWGENFSGQLGNGDALTRSTPVTTFAGGTNWKQVRAAGYHTLAVQSGINADYPLS